MAHKSERYAENLRLVEDFLKDIDVYPIDENTATIYGELKIAVINHFGPHEKAKRRKIEIDKLGFKENDLWIAAVAKQYEFVIVSADSDFQRMKEAYDLEVTTWYQNIFDENERELKLMELEDLTQADADYALYEFSTGKWS